MSRWRPIAATVVAVAGLGLSAFLTWAHYFDQHALSNCPLSTSGHGSVVNCGLVTTSPQSMIFGVPVALWGLLFFVFMVAINLPVAWRSTSVWIARTRLAASIAGMGFVLYLISMEAFVIHALCLYCSIVHLLQFVLFILVATGWNDTGYAASQWVDGEDEEDYFDEEPEEEPVVLPPGNRLPRGKARRQASALPG